MSPQIYFLKNLAVIVVLFVIIVPLCSMFSTYLLPPIGVFFEAAQLPGGAKLAIVSSVTRFGVALSLFCIAYVKLVAISDHHSEALKRRARAISLMFMVTGAWTSTIAMLIEFGGVWHIVSLVFGFVELVSALFTVYMVVRTHKEVRHSYDTHD